MLRTIILLSGILGMGLAEEDHNKIPDTKYPVELTKNISDQAVADKRALFDRGWNWAWGRHFQCPPNPGNDEKQNELIGYWVMGYVDGIKSGGNSDMPARYLRYFIVGGMTQKTDAAVPLMRPSDP
jgi:hypothetical protein